MAAQSGAYLGEQIIHNYDDMCIFCRDGFEPQEGQGAGRQWVVLPNCGHAIHLDCWSSWSQHNESRNCFTCRQVIQLPPAQQCQVDQLPQLTQNGEVRDAELPDFPFSREALLLLLFQLTVAVYDPSMRNPREYIDYLQKEYMDPCMPDGERFELPGVLDGPWMVPLAGYTFATVVYYGSDALFGILRRAVDTMKRSLSSQPEPNSQVIDAQDLKDRITRR